MLALSNNQLFIIDSSKYYANNIIEDYLLTVDARLLIEGLGLTLPRSTPAD